MWNLFRRRAAVNGLATRGKKDIETPMSMALGIWLCWLPIIFLIVLPFLGWKAAGVGAIALLGLLLVICFSICTIKIYKEGGERHA